MSVSWVKQEHSYGCGVAALAMLTGQTYEQVALDFAQPLEDGFVYNFQCHGISMQNMDRYLAEHGFAVCRLFLRDLFTPRIAWPPQPFADMHLCHVKVKQASKIWHWVVMLSDGRVLDPLNSEPVALTDYYDVLDVAAVVKL